MKPTDSRRATWSPPPRPDWVTRVNEEGRYLDLDSVVPLDEASLLDAARRRTGLDDFGDTDWYAFFQVFIQSLREEANLNLMGRLMTRSDLINMLAARLEIQETYRRHPEIEDERIERPLMIVGQGRTGTSFLLNLLSQDPDNGTLKHWECVFPCPPPDSATYATDPRIEQVEALVGMWNRVNPDLRSYHEFYARVPTEASHAMTLNFAGGPFLALLGQTPGHAAYVQKQGVVPALRYIKRVLKLLQWKNPHRRWVLKAPDAILFMPQLLEVFPDMHFIWTHRDPLKSADSVANMYGNCVWVRSDGPLIAGVLEQMLNADLAAELLSQPIRWMQAGIVPAERVCNIRYLDLEADPVAEVTRMYRQFDVPLPASARHAMEAFVAHEARRSRPRAAYQSGLGDRFQQEREKLRAYQEYFGVRSEI
ncbi:MAG: sulfotransferase [Steroidobacteraceae bacterium]